MKLFTISSILGVIFLAVTACGGQEPTGPTPSPVSAETSSPPVQSTGEPTVEAETTTAPFPSLTPPLAPKLTPATKAVVTPTVKQRPTPTRVPAPEPTATPLPASAPILAQTATPAPTNTPRPTATPLPAPVPLEWPPDVGASHFGQLGDSAPGFASAWIRPHPGRFIWGLVEAREGQYDWRFTDNAVLGWQRDRLAVLVTIWPFATWDQIACHANQPRALRAFPEFGPLLYSPCDPEAYAAWLGAVVERYDGDGVEDMPGLEYPVRHWEILSEPEMQGPELTFFQEDSAAYLELLRLSYTTIKAADTNAVVLSAGQAGMQSQFVDYWQPVLEAAGSYFDVGNVHSIGSDDQFFAPEYRAFLDSLGYEATPFWVTEALVGAPPGGVRLSEDGLARITLTGYASALAAGAQVIFNVGAHDPTGGPGQASEDTFLLMARTVNDFTSVTMLAENIVRFDMPDGRVVFALWDGAKLPQVVTGEVNVITYLGEESTSDAAQVTSTAPVLVVSQ